MKPMYESKTNVTFREFRKLHNIYHPVRYLLAYTALLAPMLFFVMFYLADFRWISMMIAIAVFTVITGIYMFVHHNRLKRLYSASVKHYDIRFYDDWMEQTSQSGSVSAEYSSLEAVIETKLNFYLRISKNHTVILDKNNCPSELSGFVKDKLYRCNRSVRNYSAVAGRLFTAAVIVFVAVAMSGGVFVGNYFSDRFLSYPRHYRIFQNELETQQQWVHDYLDWEYSTVNQFIDLFLEKQGEG